jgi:hypothetical protein
MFERPHHQRIEYVLAALDADLLMNNRCLFGGDMLQMTPAATPAVTPALLRARIKALLPRAQGPSQAAPCPGRPGGKFSLDIGHPVPNWVLPARVAPPRRRQ